MISACFVENTAIYMRQ